MGSTATEAANALGRAFAGGAGAADILRERGILNLVKSSQGLTDLSKTTLPQFREALINSLQDPVVGIAGSTDRMSKTFEEPLQICEMLSRVYPLLLEKHL